MGEPRGAERDETLRRRLSELTPSNVLIEARQRFPAGRQLELVWGPGIATTAGVATREAQRMAFRVVAPRRRGARPGRRAAS